MHFISILLKSGFYPRTIASGDEKGDTLRKDRETEKFKLARYYTRRNMPVISRHLFFHSKGHTAELEVTSVLAKFPLGRSLH